MTKYCRNCGKAITGAYRKVSDQLDEDNKLVGVYEHIDCQTESSGLKKVESHPHRSAQHQD